ncbi:MAG: YihY/virulence factor BrkB family protein [Gemmatimonas sp.]
MPDRAADGAERAATPDTGWRATVVRVRRGITEGALVPLSAATAFYSFLTIPSALSAAVAFCGLAFDEAAVERRLALLKGHMGPQAFDMIAGQFHFLVGQPRGTLFVSFALSLGVALWSAMGAAASTITALNAAYGEREARGALRYGAVVAATAIVAILVILASLALLVIGPIAVARLGLGPWTHGALIAARWPALVALFGFAVALAYRFAPSRHIPEWRWVSWGAAAAVAVWLLASAMVSFYAAHFASYARVYGSLAGVALMMLWLYASVFAIVLGAKINAEIEHRAGGDESRRSS